MHTRAAGTFCGKSPSSATQLVHIRDRGILVPSYLGQGKEGTVIRQQCIYLVNEMVPRHYWNLTMFILSNFLTLQNWVYTFKSYWK